MPIATVAAVRILRLAWEAFVWLAEGRAGTRGSPPWRRHYSEPMVEPPDDLKRAEDGWR